MILTHRPGRESNLHKNPLPATIPTGVIFILFIGGLSYFGARGQAASASGVTPPRFFQHTLLGARTSVLLRKSIYIGCTFERVKLRSLGIADFIGCTFIDCDFKTAFIAASFAKCKFIGKIYGCVFCGPNYDSYFYGDKLSYWVSNKGRLNDVDFSESILTDVDFRGGIDLSTVLFPDSYLSDKLIIKYSLEPLGVHGFAYPQKEALKIANGYFNSNIPILGGDVYKMENGRITLTLDSWYCDRISSESPSEYVRRCYLVTTDYVSKYPNNANFLFGFVVDAQS